MTNRTNWYRVQIGTLVMCSISPRLQGGNKTQGSITVMSTSFEFLVQLDN